MTDNARFLYFDRSIDPRNYDFFRNSDIPKVVKEKLTEENGDPSHIIMAAIDFAMLGEDERSIALLDMLTRVFSNKAKEPTGGIASYGEEVISHLLTYHAFAIIKMAQNHGVEQSTEVMEGINRVTSETKLMRTQQLMQAGFDEYIQYVKEIDSQFVFPQFWAMVYKIHCLDQSKLEKLAD